MISDVIIIIFTLISYIIYRYVYDETVKIMKEIGYNTADIFIVLLILITIWFTVVCIFASIINIVEFK